MRRVAQEEKKRFVAVPINECHRLVREDIGQVVLDFNNLATAKHGDPRGAWMAGRASGWPCGNVLDTRHRRINVTEGTCEHPEVLVETACQGMMSVLVPQMPFADQAGGVSVCL